MKFYTKVKFSSFYKIEDDDIGYINMPEYLIGRVVSTRHNYEDIYYYNVYCNSAVYFVDEEDLEVVE